MTAWKHSGHAFQLQSWLLIKGYLCMRSVHLKEVPSCKRCLFMGGVILQEVFGCGRYTCIRKGFVMGGLCYWWGLLMWRCLIVEDAFQYRRYLLTTKVQLCSSRKYPYSPHRRDWNILGGWGAL